MFASGVLEVHASRFGCSAVEFCSLITPLAAMLHKGPGTRRSGASSRRWVTGAFVSRHRGSEATCWTLVRIRVARRDSGNFLDMELMHAGHAYAEISGGSE